MSGNDNDLYDRPESTMTVSRGVRIEELLSEIATEGLSTDDEAVEDGQLPGGFIARLQHELRTPVTGILGMSQMLAMENLSEEQAEMAGVIESCARDLKRTLSDVFEYVALISPDFVANREEFDVADVLEELRTFFVAEIEQKQLEFRWNVPADFTQIVFEDRDRLYNALWQLIDNAVKYCHDGSIDISVAEMKDGSVVIEVKDTGPGLQASLREVLQPFRQADNSDTRSHGGCGLGLSIAHRACTLMRWSLRIRSGKSGGCRVRLGIPRS